jgi:hypothetical protein
MRFLLVVPVEGIEPPLLAEHDFESCASTSSATRALEAARITFPDDAPEASQPKPVLTAICFASTLKIGTLPASFPP